MDGMVGIGMAFIEFILATQASSITQIVKPTSDEPLKLGIQIGRSLPRLWALLSRFGS